MADHEESAAHFTEIGFEVAVGGILVVIAGLQSWLLTDHAFTLHFADGTVAIVDKPVTAKQLHRVITTILYGDVVAKNKLALLWIRVLRQVLCFYRNGDSVCRQYFHDRKLWVLYETVKNL